MKKLFTIAMTALALFSGAVYAQQKPSPATTATGTLANGTVITINYGAPALNGRVIGKDVEPMEGKVWRAGANEATVFEVSKDVTINGKKLPAGKYGFFTMNNGKEWTLIFNKTWKQWGAFNYKEADDQLRVTVQAGQSASAPERLTYSVGQNGLVSLNWGTILVSFTVK